MGFSRAAALILATTLVAGPGLQADAGAARVVRGTLTVVQEDDFVGGVTRRVRLLEATDDGKRYRLRLQQPAALDLRAGSRVEIRGRVLGDELHVADAVMDVQTLALPAAAVNGVRRALALVVNFQNSAVSCSDASIAGVLFQGSQSVDRLFQESSFGQVAFPGDTDQNGAPDVLGVSIAASTGQACDPFAWADAADTAAQAAGLNLGLYQHRVYVLPGNSGCSWAGLAHVGCAGSCRAWVATCQLPDVYAHELGHNLGLHHASTDENNDGALDCEYCDRSDFMGIGGVGWRQVNGPHKAEMGWLPAGKILDIGQQAGLQSVTLSPLESDPGAALHRQLLRIERPGGDPYHVSYRVRAGYDATLDLLYVDRANIHVHRGAGNTLFVDTLQDGERFIDSAADISITQVGHTATSLTLLVGVGCAGDPDCGSAGPPGPVVNLRRSDTVP